MLGSHLDVQAKRSGSFPHKGETLLGYILTTKKYDPGKEAVWRLENKAASKGFEFKGTEWDVGYSNNPYRVGLWRALRKLVCAECEPRRLPFSLVSFEDYLSQALKPCMCKNGLGADGLVVARIEHITSDPKKGGMLILELAKRGKHVFASDGICLSCCHPATQKLLGRAE